MIGKIVKSKKGSIEDNNKKISIKDTVGKVKKNNTAIRNVIRAKRTLVELDNL